MITQRRALKFEKIEAKSSLFYVPEETIADPLTREKLVYSKDDRQNGIIEALSILLKTGWCHYQRTNSPCICSVTNKRRSTGGKCSGNQKLRTN